MGLFSRKSPDPAGPYPVGAFWTWWEESGRGLDPTQVSAATDELTELLQAIHPGLAWYFGPGTGAKHRLTVSAGGVADGRPSAERWFRAAPAAHDTWEFSPRQVADPKALGNELQIAGATVDLSATVFAFTQDPDLPRIHVGVHHPAFSTVPEQVATQVTYLVLDWLLGEDDVARWLGQIDTLDAAPAATASADELRAAVAGLAADRKPEEWVFAEWSDGELPGTASFRPWLHWLDNPVHDRYHSMTLRFTAQANGLPADAEQLDALGDLEECLVGVLGSRGVLVGHQTHRGTRTFHAYTDGEDQNAEAEVVAWAMAQGIEHTSEHDPGWSNTRHLLG